MGDADGLSGGDGVIGRLEGMDGVGHRGEEVVRLLLVADGVVEHTKGYGNGGWLEE